MADGKQWVKLWYAEVTGDDLLALNPADRWAWVALMTYTRMHGTKGQIEVSERSTILSAMFGCTQEEVVTVLKRLPNVRIENREKCNGKLLLQFSDWSKLRDDNSLERVQKHRALKNVTGIEEKRREEKREEKKYPPKPPKGDVGFDDFWNAYPKKKSKGAAERAWKSLKPDSQLVATMLAALTVQSASWDWLKENGQYIPNPATWLNNRRWLDAAEVELPKPAEKRENCTRCGHARTVHLMGEAAASYGITNVCEAFQA